VEIKSKPRMRRLCRDDLNAQHLEFTSSRL
jgi:hypothetical protein